MPINFLSYSRGYMPLNFLSSSSIFNNDMCRALFVLKYILNIGRVVLLEKCLHLEVLKWPKASQMVQKF
mgnify:CR=1 FL=1